MPSAELTALLNCADILDQEADAERAFSSFLASAAAFYEADGARVRFDGEAKFFARAGEWFSVPPDLKPRSVAGGETCLSVSLPLGDNFNSVLEKLRCSDIPDPAASVPTAGRDTCTLEVENPRRHGDDASFLLCAARFLRHALENQHLKDCLEHFTFIDPLTGLANRNQYMIFLRKSRQQQLTRLGLVYLDMDGLKAVNELYGHEQGDRLLVQTADILRRAFPQQQVFRTGGDEFVVVCADLPQKDFFRAVNRMKEAFARPPACHVSHGTVWKDGNVDVMNEIRYAGILMQIEKQAYYSTRAGKNSLHHTSLLKETLRSLEGREFEVHLQAQVELETQKLCGAEALIRKRGLDRRLILPLDFIPLLESELLIRHVDFFVFNEICETVSRWQQEGIAELFPVSVNLSRITLMERDIAQKLAEVCSVHGVPTGLIDIEVTESVGKMDLDALFAVTEAIRSHGFTLSLDDFGSKYCNLAILTKLNFNSLKIDKSIIDVLEKSREAQVLVRHCVEICRELNGVCPVAEGIEKKTQLDFLKAAGCRRGQGYYFSRPLPIALFESRYLRRPPGEQTSVPPDAPAISK